MGAAACVYLGVSRPDVGHHSEHLVNTAPSGKSWSEPEASDQPCELNGPGPGSNHWLLIPVETKVPLEPADVSEGDVLSGSFWVSTLDVWF